MNTSYQKNQPAGSGMVLAAALFLFLSQTAAFALQPGEKIPAFTMQAEQGGISSRNIAGRVTIITYETKGTAELNRPFKQAILARWRQGDSAAPAIVPVINCYAFLGFVRSICENRVAAASKKEKLIIYTDSDGAMFRDFGLADEQSTIIIIDKKGLVRFFHAGRLDDGGVRQCVQLVAELLKE